MSKRIKLIATAMLMSIVLVGCDANTEERTSGFIMPTELADSGCKLYRMSDGSVVLYVMHCPNAETSIHRPGKTPVRTITVDEHSDTGYNNY